MVNTSNLPPSVAKAIKEQGGGSSSSSGSTSSGGGGGGGSSSSQPDKVVVKTDQYGNPIIVSGSVSTTEQKLGEVMFTEGTGRQTVVREGYQKGIQQQVKDIYAREQARQSATVAGRTTETVQTIDYSQYKSPYVQNDFIERAEGKPFGETSKTIKEVKELQQKQKQKTYEGLRVGTIRAASEEEKKALRFQESFFGKAKEYVIEPFTQGLSLKQRPDTVRPPSEFGRNLQDFSKAAGVSTLFGGIYLSAGGVEAAAPKIAGGVKKAQAAARAAQKAYLKPITPFIKTETFLKSLPIYDLTGRALAATTREVGKRTGLTQEQRSYAKTPQAEQDIRTILRGAEAGLSSDIAYTQDLKNVQEARTTLKKNLIDEANAYGLTGEDRIKYINEGNQNIENALKNRLMTSYTARGLSSKQSEQVVNDLLAGKEKSATWKTAGFNTPLGFLSAQTFISGLSLFATDLKKGEKALENKLRAQGLSEADIKQRVRNARKLVNIEGTSEIAGLVGYEVGGEFTGLNIRRAIFGQMAKKGTKVTSKRIGLELFKKGFASGALAGIGEGALGERFQQDIRRQERNIKSIAIQGGIGGLTAGLFSGAASGLSVKSPKKAAVVQGVGYGIDPYELFGDIAADKLRKAGRVLIQQPKDLSGAVYRIGGRPQELFTFSRPKVITPAITTVPSFTNQLTQNLNKASSNTLNLVSTFDEEVSYLGTAPSSLSNVPTNVFTNVPTETPTETPSETISETIATETNTFTGVPSNVPTYTFTNVPTFTTVTVPTITPILRLPPPILPLFPSMSGGQGAGFFNKRFRQSVNELSLGTSFFLKNLGGKKLTTAEKARNTSAARLRELTKSSIIDKNIKAAAKKELARRKKFSRKTKKRK